jgi:hypothetical protein
VDSAVTVILQPENVTADYGGFVEFTCRFSFINDLSHILEIYLGKSGNLRIPSNQFNVLDPHEYYVNITNTTNETVGMAGLLINMKTIQIIEFFRCKFIHGDASVFSNPAYIVGIHYPECAQPSQSQTSSLHLIPSKTLTISTLSPTSTITALESCTATLGITEGGNIGTYLVFNH